MEGEKERPSKPKSRQSIAHLPPKDNTTDIAALQRKHAPTGAGKRSRGKSLGPGGLEALTEVGSNEAQVAPAFHPKSILKPTVPLTPPKNIPSFDELRKRSTGKAKSPAARNGTEDLLIDFSTPGPTRDPDTNISMEGTEALLDPFSPIAPKSSKSSKATNVQQSVESQQGAEEQRRKEKEAILEQRAARRKSMANRRVSFAPEATLHTWSVMELAEDSTTSSASNSTRRQSSMTAAQSPTASVSSSGKSSNQIERPSTPPEQRTESLVQASPEHQRDLHQKKHRRNSDASQTSDDETFASPGDGGDSSPIRVEDSIDSDSDSDGDTAMSIEDTTSNTIRSSGSSDTQSSLDERLRQAANQAGTKGIVYDENGSEDDAEEASMELADGTVTHAFRQYARKSHQVPSKPSQLAVEDQENIDPRSHQQGVRANADRQDEGSDVDEGMTMEMTRAMGGIISKQSANRRKSMPSKQRRSAGQRRSLGDDSSNGDETMDLTVAKGGILGPANDSADEDEQSPASDEDMTMEFTNVVGGLQRQNDKRESMQSLATEDTESMDMTIAAGGILEPIEEQTEPLTDAEDERTAAMDMTRGVGKILPSNARKIGQSINSEVSDTVKEESDTQYIQPSSVNGPGPQLTTVASETGSPSLKPRLSGRRTTAGSRSTTPKVGASQTLSSKTDSTNAQTTPSKQTPILARAKTPERTPIADNIVHRAASPKKLFSAEIKARASPASNPKSTKSQDILFSQDMTTGHHTPRVVLHAPKPHQHLRRRSSGIGIDNEGFGSPKISEILSRRTSIGDGVPEFRLDSTHIGRIRFEDPRQIEKEIDAERAEEQRRESGRYVMAQEADNRQEENATLQLREMIESMTPKKEKPNRLKGRKSFAVGSAKGLLGKRPAELDDDDENEIENGTPKRLKLVSREGSPVKKVHLPNPPTKEETTGRLTRAEQRLLGTIGYSSHTPANSQSPVKNPTSPSQSGRFKDIEEKSSGVKPASFEKRLDNVVGALDISTAHPEITKSSTDEEKISLQEFLNMTNVHFIELSTTKRRHTMAQSMPNQKDVAEEHTPSTCFVAATTTLPLIELYQHATRELKVYISTGRKVIRSIEAETLTDQPLLFKEYVEARPDVKAIMDNQFRNGKTNARLQSKEGWYTWRGQLVDGLHGGLKSIKAGMLRDQKVLDEQHRALQRTAPGLISKKDALQQELLKLRHKMEQMDSIDRESLKERRQQLAEADGNISQKSRILRELQDQMNDKTETLGQASELKTEMQDQIAEANRVREENRLWPSREVSALKHTVDKVNIETGWSVATAEEDTEGTNSHGVALTLIYKHQLKLFFYPSTFQAGGDASRRRSGRRSRSVSGPSAPISLTYSPTDDDSHGAKTLSTEQRFFLQLIRSQLQSLSMMPKGSVSCQTVLQTVSAGWDLAERVSREILQLNTGGIGKVSIHGDQKLVAQLMMMRPNRSRIDVDFLLSVVPMNDGDFSATVSIAAKPIYGSMLSFLDSIKMKKIQNALNKEIESQNLGGGAWLGAVRAFEEWLHTQTNQKPEQSRPKQQLHQTRAVPEMPPHAKAELPRSPVPSKQEISTSPMKRSPLAPKTANNRVQKKALPVPTQRKLWQNDTVLTTQIHTQPSAPATTQPPQQKAQEKENLAPFDVFGGAKPAIPPEMQEAMMHTPVKKRVGALRRSPV